MLRQRENRGRGLGIRERRLDPEPALGQARLGGQKGFKIRKKGGKWRILGDTGEIAVEADGDLGYNGAKAGNEAHGGAEKRC
ncbi:MAG: hypothetical protein JSV99_04370 [Planctomycetota bacterium]|nr:MAG: hypothetical protein JSV99_04370 [Planctomycetota bacterium]